jgi:hypothetical protein
MIIYCTIDCAKKKYRLCSLWLTLEEVVRGGTVINRVWGLNGRMRAGDGWLNDSHAGIPEEEK